MLTLAKQGKSFIKIMAKFGIKLVVAGQPKTKCRDLLRFRETYCSAVGPGPMHMKEPWRRPFPSPTTCTPPRVKLEPRLPSNAAGVVADLPTSSVSSRRFSLRYAFEAACYRPRGRCSRSLSTHLDGSASPLVFRFHFWSKSVSAASDFNAALWWCAFDTLTLRADTPHPHQG